MVPSKIIDRRYQILDELGVGLSGEVYRAQGPEGIVALKVLKTQVPGLDEEERIRTFKFEFSLLKGLGHPNIVRIFDFGFDQTLQRFYFTQELIEGSNLALWAKGKDLSSIQAILLQAMQGLAYLHSQKILHGDLKPENLLITTGDKGPPQLKIIDFGLSHPGWSGWAGTPAFMPPEKILHEPVSPSSDLYSLGVVYYEILSGENPFLRPDVVETLRAQLHFVPPSATVKRPELDPIWGELLQLMLQKNPRHRLPSAEACLQFLETRGELKFGTVGLREIPNYWVGRQEIIEAAKHFLDERKQDRQPSSLLLVGERDLGGESLLTELKYEAELQSLEVVALDEKPARHPAVSFASGSALLHEKKKPNLALHLQDKSLVLSLSAKEELEILGQIPKDRRQKIELRPLNREEVESYLQDVTRNKQIPKPLLNALCKFSQGRPRQLHEALTHLLQDPLIVDRSGKWNLAVFSEVEPSLEQLDFSEESLDQVLKSTIITEPKERWSLELQRSEALAKEGKLDDSLKLLNQMETQAQSIFRGDDRLRNRALVLEKRGWIYSKQNRLGEARESFAAGLTLTQEMEKSDRVLQLKLKNFLAFILLREGRSAEACQEFEGNAEASRSLTIQEQKAITNNELGQAYLAQGQNKKAIERLQEDLKLFSTLPEPSIVMKANYNLAEALSKEKNLSEAETAYQRVAQIARRERDWDYLIRAYNGMGNLANLRKDWNTSLDYYQRSLNLAEYRRDFLCAATVAQNRGVILYENGRLDESFHDLDLSKRFLAKVNPSSHSRYLMARAVLELGEVHLRKKEFQAAENYFTEALNRSEEDANLKKFAFYPLAGMASLHLQQNRFEKFRDLYPKLVHLAEDEEEKKILADLMGKAPGDPRQGQEKNIVVSPRASDSSPGAAISFPKEMLSQILKINRALITEHDPRNLLKKILQYSTELSGAESAILIEISENGEMEVVEAFNTDVDKGQREISQQVAHRVLSSGESIVTRDAQVDQGFNQFQSVVSLHLRSIACIPIRVHQKVIGLLYMTHRYKTDLFNSATLGALEAFGDQAGLALQNSRYVRALHDRNQELFEKLEDAEDEIDRLKSDLRTKVKNPYPKILGKSRALVEILRLMDRISDTNLSIMIFGETGSGKELVARSIHENSRRKKGPFVAVNCGAIPENLIESELFGHRAGSFTGAVRDKKGLLEEGNGGTLFLDEIAELPLNTQVKLLRVLQEKEVMRIGDTRPTPIDVRIISATHRALEQWVVEGKFREDLYYRVAQMVLPVPALRDRREDLVLLAEHFLAQCVDEIHATKAPRLGRDLLAIMMQYEWPGNVRELESFLRTAAAFAERGVIHCGTLPEFLRKKLEKKSLGIAAHIPAPAEVHPAKLALHENAVPENPPSTWEDYEKILFSKALLKHDMNCEKAAEDLGVGVATVYVKMRKYGLKTKAHQWQDYPLPFGGVLNLGHFKQQLIESTFQQTEKSPYAVSKQLGLNVGTVYRHIKAAK